jgi:predicted metalloprotease
MRWSAGNRGNIRDLRGRRAAGAIPLSIGGVVVVALLSWATGTNLFSLLPTSPDTGGTGATSGELQTTPEEERMVDFVDAVAQDAQDLWQQQLGSRYQRTIVTLFRDAVESGCGFAQSATGPFYCPADGHVYLDLGFFTELAQRFGAPGDFAAAYVIAHEIGHHVQTQLGLRSRADSGANSASVAFELQADCFAGVWGHAASQPGRAQAGKVELEPGDAEEGLRAAAAIGDDRLQRMSSGRVMPEQFTHGTSEQRMVWFKRGMDTGDPEACRTGPTTTGN